jgi:hypothetical protein
VLLFFFFGNWQAYFTALVACVTKNNVEKIICENHLVKASGAGFNNR